MGHCGCGQLLMETKRSGKFGSFLLTYCSCCVFFPAIWLQYLNATPSSDSQTKDSQQVLLAIAGWCNIAPAIVSSFTVHFDTFWKYPHYYQMPHIKLWYNTLSTLSAIRLVTFHVPDIFSFRISCLSSRGCRPCTACANGSNQTRNSGCGATQSNCQGRGSNCTTRK